MTARGRDRGHGRARWTLWRVLLLLYPAPFRREFGRELLDTITRARARPARMGRLSVVADLLASAGRLRALELRSDLQSLLHDAAALTILQPGGFLMSGPSRTANERFKASFRSTYWGAVILATLAHVALLSWFPPLHAEDWSRTHADPPDIVTIPEAPLPEPPAPVNPPLAPRIGDDIGDIEPPEWRSRWDSAWTPPPPPLPRDTAASDRVPGFTPYDVAPSMRNRAEVQRILAREYPTLLKESGIGGTVVVWLYIDTGGTVVRAQVHAPSAHPSLDRAALRVAGAAEFTPAMNRDRPTAVWVQFPVTFQVR